MVVSEQCSLKAGGLLIQVVSNTGLSVLPWKQGLLIKLDDMADVMPFCQGAVHIIRVML